MGAGNHSFSHKYTGWVEKYRIYVLIFWVLLFFGCIYFAPQLINKTTYSFDPPPQTLAYKGNEALSKAFPQSGNGATNLVLFIYTTDGSPVIPRSDVQQFSLAVNASIYNYLPGNPEFIQLLMGYYIAEAMNLDVISSRYVSSNYQSTIIAITGSAPYSSNEATVFSDYIRSSAAAAWNPINNTVQYRLLGTSAFLPMLQASAEQDFLIVDGVSLPIAFLVLAYILRSLRLMLIPVLCIGTSIVITFGIMYLAACYMNVVAFTPSLMMSILVAMSFDYSLFLLSRYREVMYAGRGHKEAVQTMIFSAGHTILVSGVTLAGTFMGLMILPLEMLRTLGMGSAISIIITLLVNISLTPALLFTFHKFFPRCVEPFSCCGRQIMFGARVGSEGKSLINFKNKRRTGFWYRLGRITTAFPFNIIIIVAVVGVSIPFDLHSLNFKTSDSFSIALPRHQDITLAYNRMCEEFGYGTVYPYVLLMQPPEGETVMSDTFFNYSQTVIQALIDQVPNTSPENFYTLSYGGGIAISYEEYSMCANISSPFSDNPICNAMRYAAQTLVNPSQTAMLAYITLSFDPLDQNGYPWINSARDVLADAEQATNCTFYLTGIVSDSLDAVRFVYSALPTMGATTIAVVLVFVGIAFRSVFIPLRSVLTVMITLAFVYGFATLTYQYDIFQWLNFEGLIALGSLSWIPPLVSFSMIVGIGLDYDIFLITRVQEYREVDEYSTKDAILKGLHKTGGIITAAGVIMAIAFSGLLFSNISAMNQLSFYLVFAVLFDTFIVRSLLVPALMGLLGEANWWPKGMPMPSKNPLF